MEQKHPPWGCVGHGYMPPYMWCAKCVKEADEYEIRLKNIEVLDKVLEVLNEIIKR